MKAVRYEPVEGGGLRGVFLADDVRAAKIARPGRGTRTDIFPIMAILGGLGHPARWINGGPQVATKCGRTETPDADLDRRLKDAFNTGFVAGQSAFPGCGRANRREAARLAARGRALAASLTAEMAMDDPTR